ncbi:MAG: hypothetical protein H7831_14430 [Magnetococcus sp. WYHC-3]
MTAQTGAAYQDLPLPGIEAGEDFSPTQVSWRCRVAFFSAALGVLVPETILTFLLLSRHSLVDGGVYLAMHALISVLMVLFAIQAARKLEGDRIWMFLLAIFAVPLGPVGVVGVLFAFFMFVRYRRDATPFGEWYAALFPEDTVDASEGLLRRLKIIADSGGQAGAADITPFLDVLNFGEQRQKLAMITLISRHFRPVFAPLLKRALGDGDNAIRVQAATAVSQIENRFTARSLILERALEHRPDSPDVVLELARHFDDYAFTGILDSVRESENRERALAAYRQYLALRPGDDAARTVVGRSLIRNHRLEEAVSFFEQALAEGRRDPQMVLWYMECLYRMGRYEALNRLAGDYRELFSRQDQFPAHVNEAIALWSGVAPVTEAAP